MTFAGCAMGTTARDPAVWRLQATVQLDMNFIRPAQIGDRVNMECRVIRERDGREWQNHRNRARRLEDPTQGQSLK
jgi:acyl-coenzyme A thioesterase PaaI-like protein